MKKIQLTALAAALLPALALAEPSILVFGLADMGLQYTHVKGGEDTLTLEPGQQDMSRLNIVALEDLPNGWHVAAAVEFGYSMDTGKLMDVGGYQAQGQDVPLFDQSTLSIIGPYGEFGFGQIYHFLSSAGKTGWMSDVDAGEATFVYAGLYATGNYANSVGNSAFWISPRIAGFEIGALYSLTGSDQEEGDSMGDNNPFWNIATNYRNGPLTVVAGFEGRRYAGPRKDYFAFRIGARYDFDIFKLYGTYAYSHNTSRLSVASGDTLGSLNASSALGNGEALDTHAMSLGARVPAFGGDVIVQGQYLWGETDNEMVKQISLGGYRKVSKYALTLGYIYNFSKRTDLYFMNTYTDGSRGLNETVDVTSNCFVTNFGIQHRF